MRRPGKLRRAARPGIAVISMATAMIGGLQGVTTQPADAYPAYCDDPYFTWWDSSCPESPDDPSDDPNYDPSFDPNIPPPSPSPAPRPPEPIEEVVVHASRTLGLPLPRARIRVPIAEHHSNRAAIDFGRGPDNVQLPEGTPVQAVEGGKVMHIDTTTCGMGIIIDNGTHQWTYCHLSSRSVANGAIVGSGDQIGGSGNTGFNDNGTPVDQHLHLQVRIATAQQRACMPRPSCLPPLRCPHRIIEALVNGTAPPRVEDLPTYPCAPAPATTPRPPGVNPGHQIP